MKPERWPRPGRAALTARRGGASEELGAVEAASEAGHPPVCWGGPRWLLAEAGGRRAAGA